MCIRELHYCHLDQNPTSFYPFGNCFNSGRLLMGTVLALLFHLFVVYGVENPAFIHVIDASSSSWLQEHVSDMSERYYFISYLFM